MAEKKNKVEDRDVRVLAGMLAGVRDTAVMARLLRELLTPAELRDLALRWQLLRRLRHGETQRHIAAELGISLCKITRGSRILRQPHAVSAALLAAEDAAQKEKKS